MDGDAIEWKNCHVLEIEEYLLSKGDELQKLSVIASLPDLLKFDKNGTVAKIIPKIQQELPNSSSEFNLAVSKMFTTLMQMDIPVNLLPQVLLGIENKDPVIANAWMETLLQVIPILKEIAIKNDVLKCAMSKSQLSKTVYFRVSSCKMLGKISVHRSMNPFDVKKDVLPLVQSLCQDCFYEVRAAMCRELPNVAQGLYNLGDAIVKVNLLPLLVELSADENISVRSIAIDSVVSIIPYLGTETIKTTIIPLIKKLCTRSVTEGDTTYISFAAVYSKLVMYLRSQLTPNDAMWFLDYFAHISRRGISIVEDLDIDPSVNMLCRERCASCLPSVATMVLVEIPSEVNVKWYCTFRDLAADPCYIVRKAVSNCFSEIVNILGANNKLVVVDFTKLLRDDDEEVLQALVPNIAIIMELFVASGVLSRDIPVQATLDIGRAMLRCHNEVFKTSNWRLKEAMLRQWERLPACMPSDFIHQHYTPVIVNVILNGRAKPVRSQATRTLLIALRYSIKENHRKWIREAILTQLCNSSCCYTRQVFIQLCVYAFDIFSWRYFKEHFYLPLLSLAEDPVSNVRFSLVKLCPTLKQMLILPVDRPLQLKLENIISKMEMLETDKDVLRMLKIKLKEMRSFQINKNEVVDAEKRKIDEEDKIVKGKIPTKLYIMSILPNATENPSLKDTDRSITSSQLKQPSSTSSGTRPPVKRIGDGTISGMSFLDHHFYIDAGVSLPQQFESPLPVNKLITKEHEIIVENNETDKKEKNTIELQENDMVISVENINLDSLTENDVKALETTTTNITDDVKVNIQKITKEGEFKKRPKRHSCVFNQEIKDRSSNDAALKRRSLNISLTGESKIPVCSNRLSFSQKSSSDQHLDVRTNAALSSLPRYAKSVLNLNSNNCVGISTKHERAMNKQQASIENSKIHVSHDYNLPNSVDSNGEASAKVKEHRRKSSGLPLSIGRKAPIK